MGRREREGKGREGRGGEGKGGEGRGRRNGKRDGVSERQGRDA